MPSREGTREVPGLSSKIDINDCEGAGEAVKRLVRKVAPLCEFVVEAVIVWDITELMGRARPMIPE